MADSSKNTQKDPPEGHVPKGETTDRQLLKLSLAALGVVFGDIGIPPDQIIEVGDQMQL